MKSLGIDVASAAWGSNGAAVIEYDASTFRDVRPGAIPWPAVALTPKALAIAIYDFCRRNDVRAVALDGPQGWRDPSTPTSEPGVGRRSEFACKTQGKTAVYPVTYPANQRGWIEFSISVFDEMLGMTDVHLLEHAPANTMDRSLYVMECFPTSAWRTSGLTPLPGKRRCPELDSYRNSLVDAFALPAFHVSSHDDLQAVVAALCATGAAGGPCSAIPRGVPAGRDNAGRRVEGIIWDAKPRVVGGGEAGSAAADFSQPTKIEPSVAAAGNRVSAGARSVGDVSVTKGVLEHVNRANDPMQAQVAARGLPGGTKEDRVRVRLTVGEECFEVVIGDTHAIWRTHQTEETFADFESLFALLAETPSCRVAVEGLVLG